MVYFILLAYLSDDRIYLTMNPKKGGMLNLKPFFHFVRSVFFLGFHFNCYRVLFQKENLTAKAERFHAVGMTGFEPATPGPPDQYANRTAPHPDDYIYN